MHVEPLNLSHQEWIENKFRQIDVSLSEYSFANLYLFRQLHRYEILKLEEEFFIRGLTRDQIPFLMLLSDPSHISHLILQKALSSAQILYPIPEQWLILLERFLLQATFQEADSDYLYATSQLATYAGRHFAGKRNQVKQLFDQHQVKSEELLDQFNDAQQILNDWQKEHSEIESGTDYLSCQEAFQNFQRLHLQGKIVYVDQKPAGFIIGERRSKEEYIVHFCKASHSIKGLYQYLYQNLAQSLQATCQWMNLEQDLGIPSLQYSKLSYHPSLLMKKWRVQLQGF